MKIPFFKKPLSSFASLSAVALLGFSGVSCDTYTGTGALTGAAIGGALGNLRSGSDHYHRGNYYRGGYYERGRDKTLPGALLGAAVGGLIGVAADASRRDHYAYRGNRYDQYDQNPGYNNGYGNDNRYLREDRSGSYDSRVQPESVPYAQPSNRDGIVISPHPPFSEVDVSGLRSGQKALDPTSGKAFRVP